LLLLLIGWTVEVRSGDLGPVFTMIEENDLVVDTDRDYTQGIKVSYLHTENQVPSFLRHWSDSVPALGYTRESDRIGFSLGQNIYTPGDITVSELIPSDRPYAGWLYGGFTWQRRGRDDGGADALEHFELQLGVIGPQSLAEEAQTWVHRLRGFETPQGWDNQLETEPGIALRYYRGWRLTPIPGAGRWLQIIPHVGMSLGNVETSFRIGGMARLGLNLPDDFGPQTISSLLTPEGGLPRGGKRGGPSLYVFAGAEGWMVAYTAFLDGNLWHDSHSVSREPLVTELKAGTVVAWRFLEVGFVAVLRTPEYETQGLSHRYGSLYGKVRF
jgi:hypothetical protein